MKLKLSKMMNDALPPELPVEPLSSEQADRIKELTMKKIHETKHTRHVRPLRRGIAAVVLAAALCGTAFAAYENGWFGFDRLFGAETALVEDHIVDYQEPSEALTASDNVVSEAQEVTQEEAKRLAEEDPGPVDGPKDSEIYAAETEDYRFTLESMLTDTNAIYAIVRMEPLTEFGQAHLGDTMDSCFDMAVVNQTSGAGGSAGSQLLACENGAAYYLLTISGGTNQAGDLVTFEVLSITGQDGAQHGAALFTVPVSNVMDTTAAIALEQSDTSGSVQYYDTLTITPMSITLEGWYDIDLFESSMVQTGTDEEGYGIYTNEVSEPKEPEVTITLKDGTSFSMDDYSPYGSYGVLEDTWDFWVDRDGNSRWSCGFSQLVSLEDIAEITVDGTAYTLG